MKSINKIYLDKIKESEEKHKESYLKAVEYIESSSAIYHGAPVEFPYLPKLFSEEIINDFHKISETTHRILCKIIEEYLKNPSYRKLFPFDKTLEDLILIKTHYPQPLPVCRIDLFYDEEDFSFKFCEFNADGASAMNEDRELCIAMEKTLIYEKMQKENILSAFELFNSFVKEFSDIYASYEYKKENPTIAIVDYMESASKTEFEHFKKVFEKAGYKCIITDIRDLLYKDNLYTKEGEKIDVVYRRCVTGELINKIEEAKPLIEAYKDSKVCLIGGFKTQIIHNKVIFAIMNSKETFQFLNEEEIKFIKDHIPYTTWLNDENVDIKNIVENKDKYIIKPEDLYGARGVYAGVDYSKEEFEKLVKENLNNNYLIQEYAKLYKSKNYKFIDNHFKEVTLNNLTGLYIYNGKFKGILSRAGCQGIICAAAGGVTLGSIMIKKK